VRAISDSVFYRPRRRIPSHVPYIFLVEEEEAACLCGVHSSVLKPGMTSPSRIVDCTSAGCSLFYVDEAFVRSTIARYPPLDQLCPSRSFLLVIVPGLPVPDPVLRPPSLEDGNLPIFKSVNDGRYELSVTHYFLSLHNA